MLLLALCPPALLALVCLVYIAWSTTKEHTRTERARRLQQMQQIGAHTPLLYGKPKE